MFLGIVAGGAVALTPPLSWWAGCKPRFEVDDSRILIVYKRFEVILERPNSPSSTMTMASKTDPETLSDNGVLHGMAGPSSDLIPTSIRDQPLVGISAKCPTE